MSTTISPGLATGSGRSPYFSSSGPPWRSMNTAFIGFLPVAREPEVTKKHLCPHTRQRYTGQQQRQPRKREHRGGDNMRSRIMRAASRPTKKAPAANFTGGVLHEEVFAPEQPS